MNERRLQRLLEKLPRHFHSW